MTTTTDDHTNTGTAVQLAAPGSGDDAPLFYRIDTAMHVERGAGVRNAPRLVGWAARFDEWARVDNPMEGRPFWESFGWGAFHRSISRDFDRIRVLWNHGRDPSVGLRALGPLQVLDERSDPAGGAGLWYEVELADIAFRADLVAMVESGAVAGASVVFGVARSGAGVERGHHTQDGETLPSRRITEAYLRELGPVTFAVYRGTSVGIRGAFLDMLATDPQGAIQSLQHCSPDPRPDRALVQATRVARLAAQWRPGNR